MAIDIRTTYMGLELRSPVIAGSSGVTAKVKNLEQLERAGAGAVVLKSLFEEEILLEVAGTEQAMNRPGFVFPETADMDDFIDDDSGMTRYLELIAAARKAVDIPVIASVNCVSAATWPSYAGMIQQAGAQGLELNIFLSPADLSVGDAAAMEQRYLDVVAAVQQHVSIPVAVKVSYHFTLLAQMLQRLGASGIAGMVLFNRFFNPDFDLDTLQIVPTNVLSTPELLHMSLRWIAVMAGRTACDLAASTGVHDGDGVIKQLLAGASAVQIASVLYREGLEAPAAMVSRLKGWMDEHGYGSLSDFRGILSQGRIGKPELFDRVQFMKNYRGMLT